MGVAIVLVVVAAGGVVDPTGKGCWSIFEVSIPIREASISEENGVWPVSCDTSDDGRDIEGVLDVREAILAATVGVIPRE